MGRGGGGPPPREGCSRAQSRGRELRHPLWVATAVGEVHPVTSWVVTWKKNSPKIEFGLDLKSDFVDVCARPLASSRVKCSLVAPVITARENSFRKTATERQTSSGAWDLTASHRREKAPAVNSCFRSHAKSFACTDLKIGHRLDLAVLSHSYFEAFFVRAQTKAVLSKNEPLAAAQNG